MISFNYENAYKLTQEDLLAQWISETIQKEGFKQDEINYVFCDDAYLHKMNLEFLNHDTYTDIISFDYSIGKILQGDIYISTERVTENASSFNVTFEEELHRVMIHGILHYCGYKDKSDTDVEVMRNKENHYLLELSKIQ